jgi:hypothetical protein
MNPTLILNLVQMNPTLILILVLMNPPLILILIPTNAVSTFPFNVFTISFNVILFNYGKYACCLELCNSSLVFLVAFAISMAVPVPVCDCNTRLLLISTLLITFHLLISFNWYCGHESYRVTSFRMQYIINNLGQSGKWTRKFSHVGYPFAILVTYVVILTVLMSHVYFNYIKPFGL